MQKTYEIKLRLYENNAVTTIIQYVTGDRETMPLHIRLTGKDGAFAIPVGSVAEMNFQQGSVRFLRLAEIEDYGEGKIIYNVAAGDISLPGEVTASVTIVTGDKRLTWQEFKFRVVRGLNEEQSEPPSAVEPWQNVITAKLSDHEGRIKTLEQSGGGSPGTGGTGKDGREAEFRNNGEYIQWRYVGDETWKNLISIADITGSDGSDGTNGKDGANGSDGADGKSVELRVDAGYLQWRQTGGAWTNLILLSELQGEDGSDGFSPTISVKKQDESEYILTVTNKDGSFDTPNLKASDGKDGYTPIKGVDYFDGSDGSDGKDGYTPVKGTDYFDGKDGSDGKDGEKGSDGHTPVKGEDYYTEADKNEMVSAVLKAMPMDSALFARMEGA